MSSQNIKPTINLAAVVKTFHSTGRLILPTITASPAQKAVAAVSVTVGIVILGILASYIRRKRKSNTPKFDSKHKRSRPSALGSSSLRDTHSQNNSMTRPRSPSIRSIRRQGSVLSGVSSASEVGKPDFRKNLSLEPGNTFTPQQLGVMGNRASRRQMRSRIRRSSISPHRFVNLKTDNAG